MTIAPVYPLRDPRPEPPSPPTPLAVGHPQPLRYFFNLARDGVLVDGGGFVEATTEASAIRFIQCTLAGGADVVIVRTTPIPSVA